MFPLLCIALLYQVLQGISIASRYWSQGRNPRDNHGRTRSGAGNSPCRTTAGGYLAQDKPALDEFAKNSQTFLLYLFQGRIHLPGQLLNQFAHGSRTVATAEESRDQRLQAHEKRKALNQPQV